MTQLPAGTVTFLFIDKEEEPPLTANLFGAGEALRETANSTMTDYEQIEYNRCVSPLRLLLAEIEFHTFWTEGSTITMDQAVKLALQ